MTQNMAGNHKPNETFSLTPIAPVLNIFYQTSVQDSPSFLSPSLTRPFLEGNEDIYITGVAGIIRKLSAFSRTSLNSQTCKNDSYVYTQMRIDQPYSMHDILGPAFIKLRIKITARSSIAA